MRGIADPDRARSFITGKPRHLPLRQAPLTRYGVHDLKLLGAAGNCANEPITPSTCFIVIASAHQGKQTKRGVSNPAKSIIPIPAAAELHGERRRRGRDEAADRMQRERL